MLKTFMMKSFMKPNLNILYFELRKIWFNTNFKYFWIGFSKYVLHFVWLRFRTPDRPTTEKDKTQVIMSKSIVVVNSQAETKEYLICAKRFL